MEYDPGKKISDFPHHGFSLVKWFDTVSDAVLKRPLVFVLCMCVFGGYIAFYSRPLLSIVIVFLSLSVSLARCYGLKQRIPLLVTVFAGSIGFCFCFVRISLWRNTVAECCSRERYVGSVCVVSPNASNDGFKNIVLQLENGEKVIYLSDETYNYGDHLLVEGILYPIMSKGNPGDFDVREYYLKKGISRKIENVEVSENRGFGHSLVCQGYKYGTYLRKVFYKLWRSCTDEETASVLSAMIVGDDSHLEKDMKESFKTSNLAHMLVVSGAHVGYFSAAIGTACSFIRDPKRKIAGLSIFLVMFGFVTGWSGSAARSIFTYIIVSLVSLGQRHADRLSACALSALILLMYDPFVLFSSGIVLSFGAAISISMFRKRAETLLKKHVSFLPEEICVAVSCYVCAQLGMLPALISMGGSISLINMVIVVLAGFPAETICGTGLVLTILCSILPLSQAAYYFFVPVRGLVRLLIVFADLGSTISFGRVRFQHVPVLAVFAAASIITGFLVRSGFRKIILFWSAGMAVTGLLIRNVNSPKSSYIYFLDVGQGDCALICHNGQNLLIDGGNPGNGETIRQVMDYLGISRIDMAFISHLDKDHISGIIELWNMGLVDRIYASFWSDSSEMKQLQAVYPVLPENVFLLEKDDRIVFDEDISIRVIWPRDPVDGGNDDSLVLECDLYETSVLFTGDISADVERELKTGSNKHFQVLKVPHHGSRFSTSESFLKNKNFDAAVISVGYNHYGHPSGEVLDRLRDNDIPCYRTDIRGCVVLEVDEQDWQLDYFFGS